MTTVTMSTFDPSSPSEAFEAGKITDGPTNGEGASHCHFTCDLCGEKHVVDKIPTHRETVALMEKITNSKYSSEAEKAKDTARLDPPCIKFNKKAQMSDHHSGFLPATFTGKLCKSGERRTPFAGLLFRDVEVALKRDAVIKAIDELGSVNNYARIPTNHHLGNSPDGTPEAAPLMSRDGGESSNSSSSGSESTVVAYTPTASPTDIVVDGSYDVDKTNLVKSLKGMSRGQRSALRSKVAADLQSLLKPYAATVVMDKTRGNMKDNTSYGRAATAHYTFAPKIVDGRYLVKTVVRMHFSDLKHVHLALCPHQILNHRQRQSSSWAAGARETDRAIAMRQAGRLLFEHEVGPAFQFQYAVWSTARAMTRRCWQDFYGGAVQTQNGSVHEAIETFPIHLSTTDNYGKMGRYVSWRDDMVHLGSCHRCVTDFGVRGLGREDKIEITAWQDFGAGHGKHGGRHEAWQSHMSGFFSEGKLESGAKPVEAWSGKQETKKGSPNTRADGPICNLWNEGLAVCHQAGSVRMSYENDQKFSSEAAVCFKGFEGSEEWTINRLSDFLEFTSSEFLS